MFSREGNHNRAFDDGDAGSPSVRAAWSPGAATGQRGGRRVAPAARPRVGVVLVAAVVVWGALTRLGGGVVSAEIPVWPAVCNLHDILSLWISSGKRLDWQFAYKPSSILKCR